MNLKAMCLQVPYKLSVKLYFRTLTFILERRYEMSICVGQQQTIIYLDNNNYFRAQFTSSSVGDRHTICSKYFRFLLSEIIHNMDLMSEKIIDHESKQFINLMRNHSKHSPLQCRQKLASAGNMPSNSRMQWQQERTHDEDLNMTGLTLTQS